MSHACTVLLFENANDCALVSVEGEMVFSLKSNTKSWLLPHYLVTVGWVLPYTKPCGLWLRPLPEEPQLQHQRTTKRTLNHYHKYHLIHQRLEAPHTCEESLLKHTL